MPSKFALLRYCTPNLGDEIQSIAASRFLPRVDGWLGRDCLYPVESPTSVILNGWWMHPPQPMLPPPPPIWPPDRNLIPLLVSMHLDPAFYPHFSSPDSLAYFREHGPVGCRDLATLSFLKEHDVPAYFSGCLTLTLPRERTQRTDEILLVDLDQTSLASVPLEVVRQGTRLTHGTRERDTQERFAMARSLLKRYQTAKCVVTTRLHCALPCLAYATPVLLIPPRQPSPRFSGLLPWFHTKLADFDFSAPPENRTSHLPYRDDLIRRCEEFVAAQFVAAQVDL